MSRILLITTSYPEASASGKEAAGSFVADFAETLASRVRTVVLAPGTTKPTDIATNLSLYRFAVPVSPLSLLSATNPLHWPNIWTILSDGARAAQQLVETHRFDHVLALWALPCGYWARQIKRRFGVPYSVWALGSDIWSLGKIPIIRRMLRSVLQDSQTCFADGQLLAEDVERLAGRACHFLPSSRRLSPSQPKLLRSQPPYRLAFLGRWHPNKGADLLLNSLALLDQNDWSNIQEIRICGGGPLESRIRELAAVLSAAGRPVRVFGFLDKQQATELLGWTDYLIIPSRIESIPVIFSDALQVDCPVISTPVGDLQQLIRQHRVGIVAEGVSAAAIASAIRTATRTPPQHFREGLHSAKCAFSLEESRERFLLLTGLSSPR